MDAKQLLERVLHNASRIMRSLSPDDYDKPTPDTEWDVKTLANHMLYEVSWIPDMVEGRTIAEVGDSFEGDLLGDNPEEKWQNAADLARETTTTADLSAIAHLSYGDIPGEEYVRQVAGDIFIHSWDLAAALGVEWAADTDIAKAVYDHTKPRADELQASGLFKPPLDVAADADIQTKLLALFGRDINWRPESA